MYSPGVSEIFHTTIITYPFLVLVDLFPTSSFLIGLFDGATESKLEARNSCCMPAGDKIKAIPKVYRFQNWYMLSPGLNLSGKDAVFPLQRLISFRPVKN